MKEIEKQANNHVFDNGGCKADFIAGAEWIQSKYKSVTLGCILPSETEDILFRDMGGVLYRGKYMGDNFYKFDGFEIYSKKGTFVFVGELSPQPTECTQITE